MPRTDTAGRGKTLNQNGEAFADLAAAIRECLARMARVIDWHREQLKLPLPESLDHNQIKAMTTLLIGAAVGAIAKTLLPMPALDDRVRAAWRWVWNKIA